MLWGLIIVFIIAADQLTKYLIIKNIPISDMIPVIDKFFYLTHHGNTGAAWGIFKNGRYFFIVLTVIMLGFLIYFLRTRDSLLLRFALSFIIGGAAGNLIDRINKGSVVDFLDFYIGTYNFPTFNVADSCIVVGTFLLAYYLLFVYKPEAEQKA